MRLKEFNRNNVLEKCIQLFWKEGFRATSMDKIVDETRVNRASLYNEFQNKDTLLIASIELYLKRYCDEQMKLINADSSPESLINFFKSHFLRRENPNHPIGCYLISMTTEIGDKNPDVAGLLASHLQLMKQHFMTWVQMNTSSLTPQSNIGEQLIGLYCSSNVICTVSEQAIADNFIKSNIISILSCLEN